MRYTTRTADVDSFRGGLRHIHGVSYVQVFWLAMFLYLYLLSPYFDVRVGVLHGGMLAAFLFLAAHPAMAVTAFHHVPLITTYIFLCLFCLYNLFILIFYTDLFGTTFVNYMVQIALYILLGYVLALTLKEKSLDVDQVLTVCFKVVSFIVFLNSLIIIMEYYNPPFRNFIESFLYLPEDSNIDYLTREFRLRGVASGGAANLSLFHGTVLILLQALYIKNKIGFVYLFVASVTIFTSLLFIGRTGIVVALVGIALFHAINLILSRNKLSIRRFLLYILVFFVIVSAPAVFSMLFPDNLLAYSLNFLYQGVEGVQREGTTDALIEMINMPDEWPKLLFGVGLHTGDFDLVRKVDMGYMRMFTALGLPVAVAFYLLVLYLAKCLLDITHYKSFWIVFMFIMFLAEYKEPFIFKGYSARLMWLVIGIGIFYRHCYNQQLSNKFGRY